MRRGILFWGATLMGLAFLIGGVVMVGMGYHTQGELVQDLRNENLEVADPAILLTYEGARAPEGVEVPMVVIDTAMEAHNQALVIRTHTLSSTEGKTYSQMGREDLNRDFYLKSLTLQTSLHLAHTGLELTLFVMGTGVAFAGLGAGILLIGLPIVSKVEEHLF